MSKNNELNLNSSEAITQENYDDIGNIVRNINILDSDLEPIISKSIFSHHFNSHLHIDKARKHLFEFKFSGNCVALGGCIVDLLTGKPYNDIDIFGDKESINLFIKDNNLIKCIQPDDTNRTYTYMEKTSRMRVHLIESPLHCIPLTAFKLIDLSCCQILFNGDNFAYSKEFVKTILTGDIRIIGSFNLSNLFERVFRYANKGFNITSRTFTDFREISESFNNDVLSK